MRSKRAGAWWWVLAAIVAVGLSYGIGNRYNWEPLRKSVVLAPGPIDTPQFLITKDAYYEIALDVDKGEDAGRTECLLGAGPTVDPEQCKPFPSIVDISWTVTEAGKPAMQGKSEEVSEVYTSDTVGRVIGEFWGRRGVRYGLSLTVNKDGSALNAANPRILVKMNEADSKNYAFYSQVLFFGGISFAFLGVLLLLSGSREKEVKSATARKS
jgi:hypothetical protein